MCGIIGFQGQFEPSALSLGLAAIAHRGPDDCGEYFDSGTSTGLGHVRLSILDLSPLGHQPMVDPSGQVIIVFNGEIYNYRALRRELETDGHAFRGSSDTEVLLHMYLRHGLEMLPRLDGMFAFSVFDRRTGDLWLVRDAMGIKPVYVSEGPGGFAFCSELKGLIHVDPRRRSLDMAAIARYLTYQYCPGNGTPFEDVRRLGPGEALRVQAGKVVRRWRWAPVLVVDGERQITDRELAVSELRGCLRRSVHSQLVSDVPVGAFLSGGVDSSAVVAFARECNPDIRCFSIAFEGGDDVGQDADLPYARQVAEHLGVSLDVIQVSPRAFARDFPSLVQQLDEPIADPSGLNVLYIAQAARATGIKVLLSGAGGDDLFSGYRRHQAIACDWMRRIVPAPCRRGVAAGIRFIAPEATWARRVQKVMSLQSRCLQGSVAEMLEWLPSQRVVGLFAPQHRGSLAERVGDPLREFMRSTPLKNSVEQMLATDQRFFLADHNLIYTDKMSMAAGVEVRVPLLSDDLARLSWRMSPRLKQRGSVGKWVLKEAVRPCLPPGIVDRPKTGFGAPVRRWVRHDLRDWLSDLLAAPAIERRGIFCPDAVARLVRGTDDGTIDGAYSVLGLACIELWCRSLVDQVQPG
jgi:asparagine synthase (glutamine-hydrolysing)